MIHKFTCSVCNQEKTHESDISTGYGTNDKGEKVCFACCAEEDKKYMTENGKITLYLVQKELGWSVSNWPGTLSIPVRYRRIGKHNIARVRYDVWFNFEGHTWHGVQYGDNTQICHCKRIAS